MTLFRFARPFICSVIAACALWNPSAQADLLVYESFDYGISTTLTGANGGMGFSEAWWEDESDPLRFDYIQSNSLIAPGALGLETFGNSLRTVNNGGSLRKFAENLIPLEVGNTFWYSFLIRKDVHHTNETRTSDSFSLGLGASNARSIGFEDDAESVQFRISAGSEADYIERGPQLGTADFVVIKLSILPNTVTKMELFMNPDLNTEPIAADATSTSAPGFGLSGYITQVEISTALAARAQWSVDEFRLGETYKDVAVPEPCSGLLLGFGLVGLTLKRFRQTPAKG